MKPCLSLRRFHGFSAPETFECCQHGVLLCKGHLLSTALILKRSLPPLPSKGSVSTVSVNRKLSLTNKKSVAPPEIEARPNRDTVLPIELRAQTRGRAHYFEYAMPTRQTVNQNYVILSPYGRKAVVQSTLLGHPSNNSGLAEKRQREWPQRRQVNIFPGTVAIYHPRIAASSENIAHVDFLPFSSSSLSL